MSDTYNFLYNHLDILEEGDINNDGVLDILDIVAIVNIILNNEYSQSADINNDNSNDILDVVQLVNIILSS